MPHDPQKYLYDIRSSSEFLIEFTAGKTLDDYRWDRGFRSAVERELQIIGEATLQLDRVAPHVSQRITDYRDIIGFRHILVHGYDALDPTTVWGIIEGKLSILLIEVVTLLEDNTK